MPHRTVHVLTVNGHLVRLQCDLSRRVPVDPAADTDLARGDQIAGFPSRRDAKLGQGTVEADAVSGHGGKPLREITVKGIISPRTG